MQWAIALKGNRFHAISDKMPIDGDGFALCNQNTRLRGTSGVSDEEYRGHDGKKTDIGKCKKCLKLYEASQ